MLSLKAATAHSTIQLQQKSPRFPFTKRRRLTVWAQLIPPVNDGPVVVGCGGASMDYLVMVDEFPKPDDKIRSTSFKVQGGGNVGNALTCAARLGLRPRIITKVAGDSEGRKLVEEFESDGVDTSFVVVSKEGRSMFSHVIVDSAMKTRTAIYHPVYPPMIPDDISPASLLSALDGAQVAYFDGLSLKTALLVAKAASHKYIPILVDAEMGKEGFEDLLNMADYAVCSAKYPQAWTKAPSMADALVSMLLSLPNLKSLIVTLGEDGCIMLQRSQNGCMVEEMDINHCLETLKLKIDPDMTNPTCVSSPVYKLRASGIGTVEGRLLVGTAERIPPSELVDTTGAGDAFIGAVLYDRVPE